jgi:anaerobic magnesium-protoporphyrin IX monomethyl ester cyclase
MRLLLTTLNAKYIHINLAIRLLYQLNKEHTGLAWREFTIKEDKNGIADACAEYDVVAFSCYIWNIQQTLEVARRIKAIRADVKILLGGPEVSYDWEDVIILPEVDFIITGEGEIPFKAFLDNYPNVAQIPNLISKTEQDQLIYFQQNVAFDLNQYKNLNPYVEDPSEDLYNKVAYIETSRGCPYKCEFCLASLDNKVRYLPNDTIKMHLAHASSNFWTGRLISNAISRWTFLNLFWNTTNLKMCFNSR